MFDWDEAKAGANLRKHGISFEEAVGVFLDRDHIILDTTRPEDGEAREKAIGDIEGRCFTVVYTRRGDAHRIISARPSNATERATYNGDRPLPA